MFAETEERALEDTYRALLDLQASREPFEIVTGKRIYEDMLFKSIAVVTEKATGRVLSVACTFQQVSIVDVVVTTVPPRAQQKKPGKTGGTEKAGTKQAKPQANADGKPSSAGLKAINAFRSLGGLLPRAGVSMGG